MIVDPQPSAAIAASKYWLLIWHAGNWQFTNATDFGSGADGNGSVTVISVGGLVTTSRSPPAGAVVSLPGAAVVAVSVAVSATVVATAAAAVVAAASATVVATGSAAVASGVAPESSSSPPHAARVTSPTTMMIPVAARGRRPFFTDPPCRCPDAPERL